MEGYTSVSRWASAAEAKKWWDVGGTHIPGDVGGDRIYVTLLGAPRVSGCGPIRIDFDIPTAALQTAGRADWRQLFQNLSNVPIYRVAIHVPNGMSANKITG